MGVVSRRLLGAAMLVLVTACGGGGGEDGANGPDLSQLSITANQDVGESPLTVTGTAISPTEGVLLRSVTVNGIDATISGDTFTVDVPLTAGSNDLTIVAEDADGNTTTQTLTVNFIPPEVVSAAMSGAEAIPPSATAATGQADISVNVVDLDISGGLSLTNMQATTVEIREAYAGQKGGAVVLPLEMGADATQWNIPADTVLPLVDFDNFMQGRLYVTATDGVDTVRGQLVPSTIDLHMIELSGEHHVPEVPTAASGLAAFTLDIASRTTQIHVNVENTASAITSVNIHQEFAGHNGPGILSLQEDMMEDPGDPDHWFLTDLALSALQDQAYSAGELYFNVSTVGNPTGELRGQIAPDAIDVFYTDLSGLQVVGDGITIQAVNTNATAEAATTGDPASKTLTIYLNTNDLDDATSVTINQAPAGQHGPVVLTLAAEPDDDNPADGITRRWFVRNQQLTDAQWAAYASQGLYANVTTPAFPVGEVRGQLIPPGSSPATDPTAFQVLERSFTAGEVFTAFPEVVWVSFTKPVLAESLNDMNVIVQGAGGDMGFGEGNEVLIQPNTRDVSSADPDTVILGFLGTNAGEDTYRLLIIGDSNDAPPLTDANGLIFDGDANGSPGGNYQAFFAVSDALQVTSTSFAADEQFTSFPSTVSATFTKAVDASTVNAANIFVEASGGDATFGDGNETVFAALGRQVSPDGLTIDLTFDSGAAQADTYQLVVVGDGGGALMSLDGQALDGDGDLMPGGNYAKSFIYAPQAATFTRVQTEIFDVSCVSSSCHDAVNPAAGLSLVSGVAYDNLVNQMAVGGGTLVIPTDPDNSVLVGRIEGTITPQMPIGGVLSASLQLLVRDWIANGAQNN